MGGNEILVNFLVKFSFLMKFSFFGEFFIFCGMSAGFVFFLLDDEMEHRCSYRGDGSLYEERWLLSGEIHRGGDAPAVIQYHHDGITVRARKWYQNGKLDRVHGPAHIWYHTTGSIGGERWHLNGECHRVGGPAFTSYFDGSVVTEQWFKNGELDRDDGPAWIDYLEYGVLHHERWYQRGLLHRVDGPAHVHYYTDEEVDSMKQVHSWRASCDCASRCVSSRTPKVHSEVWYRVGQKHRGGDLPAITIYEIDGRVLLEAWYRYGKCHRDGAPSNLEYSGINGSLCVEQWQQGSKLHRDDGPAEVKYRLDGSVEKETWYQMGTVHRCDGPAVVYYRGDEPKSQQWFLNGVNLTEASWRAQVAAEKTDA